LNISPNQVLAAIVAFNPDPPLESLCTALLSSGSSVLVLDNASQFGQETLIACQQAGAEVLRLADNIGVSGALAVAHERASGYSWLLTLDQDTRIDDGFVQALASSPSVRDPQVAMIGPRILDFASGDVLQGSPGGTTSAPPRFIITSGALCRVAALDDVGGFREDLFIDHVDHDICLRLRRRGWTIAVEAAVTVRHSIGQMRSHSVMPGLTVRNSHHSADRQYYKYRNYLLLLRDGTARIDPRWCVRTALALSWGPLKIMVFETSKWTKLRAITAGIRDGLLGRAGSKASARAQER
jgi:rhamnosyltransferase